MAVDFWGTHMLSRLILILLLSPCLANSSEEIRYKDWAWSPGDEGYAFAGTLTDSGNLLALFCYYETGECVYTIVMALGCDKAESFPAIMATDQGVEAITLVCAESETGQGVYIVSPYDTIDRLVKIAAKGRMVVAMEDVQFKVTEFSFVGSTAAINEMLVYFEMSQDERPVQSSPANGDQIL